MYLAVAKPYFYKGFSCAGGELLPAREKFAEKLEKRVDFGRIWWYPNKAVREGGLPQALRRTGFLNLLRIKFTKDEKTC